MDEREIRPGWLPPKAPVTAPRRQVAPRPSQFVRAAPVEGPASPLAVTAIVLSAISVVLLVLSIGVGFMICGLVSVVALGLALTARKRFQAGQPGRESQIKTAFVFSIIGLVLSAVAAAVWLGLESNGITPTDLQDWLERELDRRRAR